MAARDGRMEIVQEYQFIEDEDKQKALRFLLNKMGRQPEDSSMVWRKFFQVQEDYWATAKILKEGRTYPLQGDFNDAREDVAQELGSPKFNQEALRTLLIKMGRQLDGERVWYVFEKSEKESPQLYYKVYYESDPNTPSWHEFEDKYSARIESGEESISDIMSDLKKSRMTRKVDETYATARIEAALRMTKGDTEKAANFLALMGKRG